MWVRSRPRSALRAGVTRASRYCWWSRIASFVVTLRGPRARIPRHHAHTAARTVAPAGAASHNAQVMGDNVNRASAFALGATRAPSRASRNTALLLLVLLPW